MFGESNRREWLFQQTCLISSGDNRQLYPSVGERNDNVQLPNANLPSFIAPQIDLFALVLIDLSLSSNFQPKTNQGLSPNFSTFWGFFTDENCNTLYGIETVNTSSHKVNILVNGYFHNWAAMGNNRHRRSNLTWTDPNTISPISQKVEASTIKQEANYNKKPSSKQTIRDEVAGCLRRENNKNWKWEEVEEKERQNFVNHKLLLFAPPTNSMSNGQFSSPQKHSRAHKITSFFKEFLVRVEPFECNNYPASIKTIYCRRGSVG